MFWLFLASLLALVCLFSFKLYEHSVDGLVMLSGSRRALDRNLSRAGKRLQRHIRQAIKIVLSKVSNFMVQVRRGLASALRTLASRIDLR